MSKATNVPPLAFKYFQGGIIDVSPDGRTVQIRRRVRENSDISVAFTTRAVAINEKICFRFKKTTGSIRYGFSRDDPGILNNAPSTVSASKFFQSPGWSTRLSRESSKMDDVWYYYADSSGDVHIARNGQDETVYFSKVNASGPLWAIILIDADTALEFVDAKAARVGPPARRTRRQLVLDETVNATSYGAEDLCFENLSGRGIILSEDYPISQYTDMSTNIVYSNRPMVINEMVCLSFSEIDNSNNSTIDFGFTRCDTESTNWVVTLEKYFFKQGNILHFFVNSSGDVQYGVNGKDIKQICFGIDTSISVWATIQFHYNCTLILNNSVRLLRQWVTDKVNETRSAAMQAVLSSCSHEQVSTGHTLSKNQTVSSQLSGNVQARTEVNPSQQEATRTSQSNQTRRVVTHSQANTASTSSSQCQAANVSPLAFKYFQGGIIDVSPDGRTVQVRRRVRGNSDISVAFTTRAVEINEKICFRFKKTAGSIRYGFSRDDPGILNVAPNTASASKFFQSPGWSTRLSRESSKLDDVWYYYADSSGDVHIARNGQDEIVYFSKVNTGGPLWAIILIDADTALEFVDPKAARVGPPARGTRQQLVLDETVNATSYGAGNLCFQNMSGQGIILSEDYPISQYTDMSNNIVYSNRPMVINEMVCLSFSEIDNSNNSTIDFGFTRCDSESTDWVVTLEKYFFKEGNILHFFVNSSGDVQYGVNGKDIKQICFGIDTSISFWATIQFHCNCTLILNNSVRLLRQWVIDEVNETRSAAMQAILSSCSHEQVSIGHTLSENQTASSQQSGKVQARTEVNPSQQEVTSDNNQTKKVITHSPENTASVSSSQNQTPLRFHSVHGENVEVLNGGSRVRLCEEDGMGGIAFSARPIRTNEAVFFRIMETSFDISFGFTRYDPVEHAVPDTIALQTCLPPGYWVSCLEDFSKRDNIWYFYVSSCGDIHIGVNGKDIRVYFSELYFHDNDHWAFVEIWGDTVLEFVDSPAARIGPPAQRTSQDIVLTTTAAATCPRFYVAHGEQVKVLNDGYTLQSSLSQNHKKGRAFSNRPIQLNEMIRILFINVAESSNFIDFGFTKHNPSAAATLNTLSNYKSNGKGSTSGYWMTDLKQDFCVTGNILHFHVNALGDIQYGVNGTNIGIICAGVETGNPLWAVVQLYPNNSTIKFVHHRNEVSEEHSAVKDVSDALVDLKIGQISAEGADTEQNKATSRQQSAEPSAPPDTECIICTMEDANTAFSCGHICTCYKCAKEVWKGSGNGRCPICRAKITQILRTYR